MSLQLRASTKSYERAKGCSCLIASRRQRREQALPQQALGKGGQRQGLPRQVFSGVLQYIRAGVTLRNLGFILTISLTVIIQFAPAAAAQRPTKKRSVLPPSRTGLSPIHQPDIQSMEPEVRDHLTSAQNALAAAIKDPAMQADKLGALYGVTGEIYQAYSLNSPAKECYLNALRLAPKDFRWLYLMGKLHEREGDTQKAITYYETARQFRPDYFPVFVSVGNIYLQLSRLGEAEANFRDALKLNENIAAAQYGLGQAALSKRSYADAVRHLEKALLLAPDANRLHYALAMAYRGLGDIEKAQFHLAVSGSVGVRVSDPLLDGLQDLTRGARLHLIRGRSALEARRFSEAADEFRKAVAEQPDSIPAHFNLGAALTQTEDLPGAVEQFEKTLSLDPHHVNAHYNLGVLLAQADRHEESITHLRSAVNAQPNDVNARFLLAQELLKVRRLEEAETELSRVVQAEPDNEDALLERVTILLVMKQYRLALHALERAHEQSPRNSRTSVTLAYVLAASPQYDQRDGKRALGLAQAAYEATGLVNHGSLVAMALAELGRCDEAAAWARRMSAKAAGEVKLELVEKLKAELNRYENARPCRPIADITFSDSWLSR